MSIMYQLMIIPSSLSALTKVIIVMLLCVFMSNYLVIRSRIYYFNIEKHHNFASGWLVVAR